MPWELTGNSITANGGFLGTTDAQPLSIRTNNAERMRLTPTGELLIGTTSPVTGTRLRVAGGGATINNVAIGTDAPPGIDYPEQDRTIGVTGTSHTLRLQSPNAVALHTGPSGTTTEENQRLTVNTAGNVGIGTTAPAHKLDVAGTMNATSINAATIDATDVRKSGSSLVSSQWSNVTDGISYGVGNVGIGAVNPSYKLNVDGAMNATSINAGTIDATDVRKSGSSLVSSQWIGATGGISYDAGSVGIGAVNPSYKLNVDGAMNATSINAGTIDATDVRTNGSSLVSSQWIGATGGGISYAAGNVGIGTISAAYKLNVDGAMNATFVNAASVNAGTVDATDVRKSGSSLVSSQWSNVASGISYGVGNVGIGKTAEAIYRLDVAGAINATDVRTNGSSLVSSQWSSASGGISYGGNVAIGTAPSAGAKLSVSGGGATINNIAIGTDVAGVPGINYPNEAETIGVATTTATLRLQSPNGLTFHTGAAGGTPVDNQRVTITSGGNVGIGTTTPSVKLDVAGPVNATDVRTNGSSLVSSQWTSVAGGISYATGNVGVGTTVPDRPLTIQGSELVSFRNAAGATKWHINDRGGSGDLNVAETGVADGRLYLRAGGNVGISTTNPQSRLQVRNLTAIDEGTTSAGAWANFGSNAFLDGAWKRVDTAKAGVNLHMNADAGGQEFRFLRMEASGAARNLAVFGSGASFVAEGNLGIGTTAPQGKLDVRGDIRAGNSDLYFTKTDHNHTGIGNAAGFAAIENAAAPYDALMILGRAGTPRGRTVKLWDYLQVNGGLDVNGGVNIQGGLSLGAGQTLSSPGRLHISGEEILFLLNKSGVIISQAWGGTGSLHVDGTVRLGANNAQVHIGGNRNGPFMQLHDDLWFSDPQNGSIEIRAANTSQWGRMVGFFNSPSSIEYKKDARVLGEPDLVHLMDDALKTDIVRFRYKGENETSRQRLGVIVENCPNYLVGEDSKSLSSTEYIAMLHGALKVLANRVATLENNSIMQA